ncbi:UNVERIFIED_ORG: hypothetical protein M2414_005453 [Rahnella aquatilis]
MAMTILNFRSSLIASLLHMHTDEERKYCYVAEVTYHCPIRILSNSHQH